MEGVELGVGVIVRAKDDDIIAISQNIPVHPGKHSHVTESSPRSIHSPLVQLMMSHIEMLATGVGETRIELLGKGVKKAVVETVGGKEGRSKLSALEKRNVIVDEAIDGVGVENGTSKLSELEKRNVTVEEAIDGVGVENGTSKLSELEMKNINDDVGTDSGITGVGVGVRKEEKGRRTSQKSPVHPAKHRQV